MSSTQLKVTLPAQLYDYIQARTQRFGLTMSAYLKYLILEDIKHMEIPEFTMSQSTEKTGLKALKDFRSGRTKKIRSVDDFINSL
jgi:antitoxin component of RelBE/YafQ-DinJ toxin-antitoxin module